MATFNYWENDRLVKHQTDIPPTKKNKKLAEAWVSEDPAHRHVCVHVDGRVEEIRHPWFHPRRY